MLASGRHPLRNYLLMRLPALRWILTLMWSRRQAFIRHGRPIPELIEGIGASDAHQIKAAVSIPVFSTGGWQHASRIAAAIRDGHCDAVSISRARFWRIRICPAFSGRRGRPRTRRKACTYCNLNFSSTSSSFRSVASRKHASPNTATRPKTG